MIYNIFPNYFYTIITPPNKEELLDFFKNISHSEDQNFFWGNDCKLLQKTRLDDTESIVNFLSPSLEIFFNDLRTELYYHINILEVWKNTYLKGSFQEIHDHVIGDCNLSLVLFLTENDENSSKFYFYNRNSSEISSIWKQTFNYENHFIDYKKGDILFFPSHMMHGVTYHNSEEKRETISINMKVFS
jgi:hypothetical protein